MRCDSVIRQSQIPNPQSLLPNPQSLRRDAADANPLQKGLEPAVRAERVVERADAQADERLSTRFVCALQPLERQIPFAELRVDVGKPQRRHELGARPPEQLLNDEIGIVAAS